MKIQINSLEALERLIGNDKEMEIAVKQSVLNEFAKKHLKSIANSEAMQRIAGQVNKELRETGFYGILEKGTSSNSILGDTSYLSPKAKELVKRQVGREMDAIISSEISKIRETIILDINSRLNIMASSVSECIREEVQKETIEKLVHKKLRDLLEK